MRPLAIEANRFAMRRRVPAASTIALWLTVLVRPSNCASSATSRISASVRMVAELACWISSALSEAEPPGVNASVSRITLRSLGNKESPAYSGHSINVMIATTIVPSKIPDAPERFIFVECRAQSGENQREGRAYLLSRVCNASAAER